MSNEDGSIWITYRRNLKTLSLVFNEKEFSEEYYQKIIVDKIGSRHRAYRVCERDFVSNIEDISLQWISLLRMESIHTLYPDVQGKRV